MLRSITMLRSIMIYVNNSNFQWLNASSHILGFGETLMILHALLLNRRTIFKIRINFDVKDIFQKPAWHLNSSTNLSLTFKTCLNSDANKNCRPTPNYSAMFLIWSWENIKHFLKAHLGIQSIYYSTLSANNPKSPCIANPDQLHMQHPQGEFSISCSVKPVHMLKITTYQWAGPD